MADFVIRNKDGKYIQIYEIQSVRDLNDGGIAWTDNLQHASVVQNNFVTFFKKMNPGALKDLEILEITDRNVVELVE